MAVEEKRSIWIVMVSFIAIGFGVLTIKSGGTVLFGDETARQAAGNYVPFVLWFNFLAGFAYVLAGAGLWLQKRWAVWLSIAIALATVCIFLLFGVHVIFGGAFELRTVIALSLRSVVWLSITGVGWHAMKHNQWC